MLHLLFCLALFAGQAVAEELPETQDPPPGGEFHLQSSSGSVSLADFRGKLVFLYFGYTKCPDICPTSLAFMTQAINGLTTEELARVQPIMVSLDPKRDALGALGEYVRYFHPAFIGLTGTDAEVAEVAKLYGVQYLQVDLQGSAFGYALNHSAAIYLIDTEGSLRFVFPHETSPVTMLEAMRYLLAGN